METRPQAVKVLQILRSGHELKSMQQFLVFSYNKAIDLAANKSEVWLFGTIMV